MPVNLSGAAASWPMRCGATKRSMEIAASAPASAAVIPLMPDSVSTSTRVIKKVRCTWPRPQAGWKSAGSGRSRTRDRTRVIAVDGIWRLSGMGVLAMGVAAIYDAAGLNAAAQQARVELEPQHPGYRGVDP